MVELLALLRTATVDDVALALDRAMIEPPLTTAADLLEFYNRMLDVMTGEDEAAEFEDQRNIPAAPKNGKRRH